MATAEDSTDGRRLTISERAVRDIVENAVLRLQVELGKTYATTAAVERVEMAAKEARDTYEARTKALEEEIESLKQDKAGREAVTNFKRWLTGGALLATVFMAIQVAISIWLVTSGARH